MTTDYQRGLREGRRQLADRLLAAAADFFETATDAELSQWIGIPAASLSQWRLGYAAPQKSNLRRIFDRIGSSFVDPLAEIEPVSPARSGAGWHLDSDAPHRQSLRDRLENRCGVYLFYDSRGHVTYVGQAKGNLFLEIEQRLMQVLRHAAYSRGGTAAKLTAVDLVQGDVVRFVSAYATMTGDSAHNIEAVLIRAFINNHQNRKSASIRLGDDWTA